MIDLGCMKKKSGGSSSCSSSSSSSSSKLIPQKKCGLMPIVIESIR